MSLAAKVEVNSCARLVLPKAVFHEDYVLPHIEKFSPVGPIIPRAELEGAVQILLPADGTVVTKALLSLFQRTEGLEKLSHADLLENAEKVSSYLFSSPNGEMSAEFFSPEKKSYVFPVRYKKINLFRTSGGEVAVSAFASDGKPVESRDLPDAVLAMGHSLDSKVVFLGEAAVSSLGVAGIFPVLKSALHETEGLASNDMDRFDAWSAQAFRKIQARGILEFYLYELVAKGWKGLDAYLTPAVADAIRKVGPVSIAELKELINSMPVIRKSGCSMPLMLHSRGLKEISLANPTAANIEKTFKS